ncbi:hypothetical protein BURPS1710b_0776 [Burkholderia pseudomallei 1710b]|uniref:Uncharacterized protein n=1 Tax=Burkholderia pseudomallei (strain 1710b) TaxID=320372 RepID=Q3JW66_BURP1|nr:hypothetical protein BURPS1710b_0776 [Burkholderia pseudomallei 1710b]
MRARRRAAWESSVPGPPLPLPRHPKNPKRKAACVIERGLPFFVPARRHAPPAARARLPRAACRPAKGGARAGLAEHHRLRAVQHDPVLDVPLDRARERHAFDVAADGRQLVRRHAVIDALDFLLDDRAFVEVGRHVVRGRADQLHAAVERLVVRLRALEARQERVMDVDRAPREPLAQGGRQDLHVAREHDEIGRVPVDHLEHARFLRGFRVGRRARGEREMMERNVVTRGELIEILVVRHDRRDLDRQLARAVAEQQVVQAMADLRHEDHDARLHRRVVQLPAHRERLGERRELGAQGVERGRRAARARLLEMHAHEEFAGAAVAELRRIEDIAAALEQKARDRVNDAAPVRARQFQDKAVIGRHDRDSLLKFSNLPNNAPRSTQARRRRREQRVDSARVLCRDRAVTQQAVEHREARVDGGFARAQPCDDLVDAGEQVLGDFAVLVMGHEIARQRQIVDEDLLGLRAFRQRAEHVRDAAGNRARGELRRDARFLPAFLRDRVLDPEPPADAARDDVIEHARIGRLRRAAAAEPHRKRRRRRIFYDAVQMHRIRHRTEEARRGPLDVRERRIVEAVADRVDLVAPADDRALGGERADRARERHAARVDAVVARGKLDAPRRKLEHVGPARKARDVAATQPADLPARDRERHVRGRIEAARGGDAGKRHRAPPSVFQRDAQPERDERRAREAVEPHADARPALEPHADRARADAEHREHDGRLRHEQRAQLEHLQRDGLRAVRIDELRQEHDEEQRHLRIQQVADHALAKDRRQRLRRARVRGGEALAAQRLDADPDQIRAARELEQMERDGRRAQQRGDAERGERRMEQHARREAERRDDAGRAALRDAAREHLQVVGAGRDGDRDRRREKQHEIRHRGLA